jgi:quercetin dioxygenase-like cupin family protein
MQFLNLTSGTAFTMGKGRNWRVVHPEMGASFITLNHAMHDSGNEFVQHIHDYSDDIIIVLDGAVALRQGQRYTPALAGEALMIPAGEVHGTVNTGAGVVRMVSFQSPPDMALYRGERNKTENERPVPAADRISTVQVVRMASGSPDFRKDCDWRQVFGPQHGSSRMLLEHGALKMDETVALVESGREGVLVVLTGEFALERPAQAAVALTEGAVVLTAGGEAFRLLCQSSAGTVIHCSALPGENAS